MKALSITLLTALCFAFISAPSYAAIPAPTITPTPVTAPVSGGAGGPDMAMTLLFVAGVFLAGAAAVFLIRRSGGTAGS